MLRTPDGVVEKVAIEERFIDCAPYVSRSGATFNGCMVERKGELIAVRGLYKIFNEPLYRFSSRGKITRDLSRLQDLIMKFIREFGTNGALVYYDNYMLHIYDSFRKAVMLEDTPAFEQGHLFIYRLRLPIDLFIYRLRLPIDLSGEQKMEQEAIYNHKIAFSSSVSVKYDALDGLYLSPGYGFMINAGEDATAKISSPDHGEKEVRLAAGQYLFLHSPPRKNVD